MSLPRILVCGGRDYNRRHHMFKILDQLCYNKGWITEKDSVGNWLPRVVVISGKARGADTIAIDWAIINWLDVEEYPADWAKYGKAAGDCICAPCFARNDNDEGKPDYVVAFPGGRGTADMIRRAQESWHPCS